MGFFYIFVLVFILIGCLFATAIGLPGNYAMMLVLIGFGFISGFAYLQMSEVAWLVGALILGEVIEFFAGYLGVKREKAGFRAQIAAILGGIAGGIIGSGILPIVGSLIGVVAGVFLATYGMVYYERKNTEEARRVALSASLAQALGTGAKVLISLLVITAVIFLLISG